MLDEVSCDIAVLWLLIYIGLVIDACDPDSKVHGAYMGPTCGRQDPGVLHVGPMNLDTSV